MRLRSGTSHFTVFSFIFKKNNTVRITSHRRHDLLISYAKLTSPLFSGESDSFENRLLSK
jgi:hypothetical protein